MKSTKYALKQRNNGRWFIEWNENGTRHRKALKTNDLEQAQVSFCNFTGTMAYIAKVKTGKPTVVNSLKVRFKDAVDEFIWSKYGIKNAWNRKSKPQCVLQSTIGLGLFKRFTTACRITFVEDITYSNLQGYISSIKGTVSNDTINKHISRLRRLCKDFVYNGYLDKNYAEQLDTYKTKTPVRYSFSKDEWKQIKRNADPRFLPFFELMLETGIRACDMWNLTKDNFPGGDHILVIQEKTGDKLYVPISKRAQEIVAGLEQILFPWADKSWWQERGEFNQRIAVTNDLWKCFGGRKTRGCLERGRVICKPNNIRLHTFRHTFAMWKLAKLTPLTVIKDLMGHRSIRMAELYASQLPKSALAQWV